MAKGSSYSRFNDTQVQILQLKGAFPNNQTVNVYEIDKFLSPDSIYYINDNVPIKQLLGSFSLEGVTEGDTVISL